MSFFNVVFEISEGCVLVTNVSVPDPDFIRRFEMKSRSKNQLGNMILCVARLPVLSDVIFNIIPQYLYIKRAAALTSPD